MDLHRLVVKIVMTGLGIKEYFMKTNYCGREAQKRMKRNGWILKLAELNESDDHLYERLSKDYSKVKVYYDTTMIRGLHTYFAFVKP